MEPLRVPTSAGSFLHICSQCVRERKRVCIEGLKERHRGKVSETKFRVSACSSICLHAFGLHMCVHAFVQRLYVCTPLCVSMVEVLLPCNCGNDMSSTKKNSERVEWNAMDTYERTHTFHLQTVYGQAPLQTP